MPLIPYEDLEFLNAYEIHFQKSSEILENTIDFHKLYHINNEQFQKSVHPNHIRPTKKCNWEDIKKYISDVRIDTNMNSAEFLYNGKMAILLDILKEAGPKDLSVTEPSLEEIFMNYYE